MNEEIVSFAAENTIENGRLPLSLSIENAEGLLVRVADVGARLPVSKTLSFSADINRRQNVKIRVYAGERPIAEQNMFLFEVRIEGVAELKDDMPLITVKFEVKEDGAIVVNAIDEGSVTYATQARGADWIPNSPERAKIFEKAINNAVADEKTAEKFKSVEKAKEMLFKADIMLKNHKRDFTTERKTSIKDRKKNLKGLIKKTKPHEAGEELIKQIDEMVASLYEACMA